MSITNLLAQVGVPRLILGYLRYDPDHPSKLNEVFFPQIVTSGGIEISEKWTKYEQLQYIIKFTSLHEITHKVNDFHTEVFHLGDCMKIKIQLPPDAYGNSKTKIYRSSKITAKNMKIEENSAIIYEYSLQCPSSDYEEE